MVPGSLAHPGGRCCARQCSRIGAPAVAPAVAQPSSCTMIRLRWISSRSNWTAAAALAAATSGASTSPKISPLARNRTTRQGYARANVFGFA